MLWLDFKGRILIGFSSQNSDVSLPSSPLLSLPLNPSQHARPRQLASDSSPQPPLQTLAAQCSLT